ncbi:hypothetical protein BCF74_106129 [Knoellia remsis]|uniref:Uncharacterized protein n=1 Tax=Knoellia remsis TaxID=407159 RepID=A0A2T0UU57_9MICO|nr:hypothetical protein [Knoellia remsis]PRY61377.1 hypothetical protein BCF74_106129 [Knoellia remsis]
MSGGAPAELVLADAESLQDLGRYAARARALDADGAMRLQAVGPVLAAWVGVLPGSGVLGSGTTVGLRTSALAEPVSLDVVVPLAAVSDRVARPGERAVLPVPPMTVTAPWTAVSPPRSGWEPMGSVSSDALRRNAVDGIAEVAAGTPDGAGAAAVATLRQRVWGRPMTGVVTPAAADEGRMGGGADDAGEVPAALAFAAYALGFVVADGEATLARNGRWFRLTTLAGHALTRA